LAGATTTSFADNDPGWFVLVEHGTDRAARSCMNTTTSLDVTTLALVTGGQARTDCSLVAFHDARIAVKGRPETTDAERDSKLQAFGEAFRLSLARCSGSAGTATRLRRHVRK
jgi:hypothetical protein